MSREFDLTVNAHRLHGQRFGSASAPLVLALHGLVGTMKSFDFLGEQLGGDDVQLVALDLRGRGRSETTTTGTYGWENHALDVLAVADALGHERFALIGRSMGASVCMKVAELDQTRLDGMVLVDVAGRVDRGVGAVIADEISRSATVYDSVESRLDAMRSGGLIAPWTEYRDRAGRYDTQQVAGGFTSRACLEAIAEDRAYTMTQHPYERWRHLTMRTLLLRATRELRPGTGFCVPADDRDLFIHTVPGASVVEIDANHLTIDTHPDAAAAIRHFLFTP